MGESQVNLFEPEFNRSVKVQTVDQRLTSHAGALDELDPKTREVFVLRYFEQLSLAEVAAMVDESLGTVKSRIQSGRQRLEILLRAAEKS